MPLFLLANWRWIAPTAAAAILGLLLVQARLQIASYKVEVAEQSRDAEKLRADITKANADKDAQASEFARRLDEVQSDAQVKIAAAADDAERSYIIKLRDIAKSRRSCESARATEAVNSGILAERAERSQDGLFEEIGRDFRQVGESCNRLVTTVKTCVAWAAEVGR